MPMGDCPKPLPMVERSASGKFRTPTCSTAVSAAPLARQNKRQARSSAVTHRQCRRSVTCMAAGLPPVQEDLIRKRSAYGALGANLGATQANAMPASRTGTDFMPCDHASSRTNRPVRLGRGWRSWRFNGISVGGYRRISGLLCELYLARGRAAPQERESVP